MGTCMKAWIKQKIWNIVRFGGYKPLNVSAAKFFPYEAHSDNYCLKIKKEKPECCEAGLPVPPKRLFVGYGSTTESWLQSGAHDVKKMWELLGQAGFNVQPEGQRILDFGCAAGRMTRHLKPLTTSHEIWGTDISAPHIIWLQQYFPAGFNFLTTTTIPHLPFEDGYFDLIFSGSVFTHIDDLADAWFLELRRLLKPGGFCYVTLHDEHSVQALLRRKKGGQLEGMVEAHINELNESDVCVLDRDAHSQVFYRQAYLVQKLEKYFRVCSAQPMIYGYQTAIVLQKL